MTDLSPIRRAAADQPVRTPVEAILALAEKPIPAYVIRSRGQWNSDVEVWQHLGGLVDAGKAICMPPVFKLVAGRRFMVKPSRYYMTMEQKEALAERYKRIEDEWAARESEPVPEPTPSYSVPDPDLPKSVFDFDVVQWEVEDERRRLLG